MRITVIEHEAAAPLGHLSGWLGLPCDVVRPYKEEEIPERAADGLIVLGGEAAAWEDERFPWLPATRALLRRAVGDGTPTLGVCLGAQLLTSACGGTVERRAAGLEAGVCEVAALPAAAGDPLMAGARRPVPPGRDDGAAAGRGAAADRRPLPEPGLPAGRGRLGRPVPPRGHAGDLRLLGRRHRPGASHRAGPRRGAHAAGHLAPGGRGLRARRPRLRPRTLRRRLTARGHAARKHRVS